MNRRALLAALLLAPGTARAAGAGGDKKPELYQRFPAIAVGVRRPNGRRGVMTVEAGVDAPDQAVADRVAAAHPRLRAGWFAVTNRFAAGLKPGAPPDADQLAKDLQAETDRVLGRKGATFLLGSILVN